MINLIAIAAAAAIFLIYAVLAPYVRFFIRVLPRMIFDDLTEADKRVVKNAIRRRD